MSRGKFARRRKLSFGYEKLAAALPHMNGGLSILFSRPYLECTALVTITWFLMDFATYGIALFTPTI
jgi:hypothetical protein